MYAETTAQQEKETPEMANVISLAMQGVRKSAAINSVARNSP